ncbi:hypothetical protein M527_18160 [Sphingobium indicum IP26]|uniref:hypothetical protein n=1 Tax=Sphingobium TaxID=165695 RepID=UPI00037AE7A4|nr:hypothetical protein [Sphingobium sp. HDIP04]EPR17089.1 hypothetical protein M527_18160 [Sphingobium indicum IP26]EQB05852.1 hypothetical protein L286_07290 [Sphingobium sp. HDIP04]
MDGGDNPAAPERRLTRSALLLAGRLVLTALVAHLALPVFLLLLASPLAGAVAALLVATLIAALIVLVGHVSLLFTFIGEGRL